MDNESDRKYVGNQGVKVIARAVEILRVLKADNTGLSLGEIAKRTSLPRATVQRIVNALLTERLLIAASRQGGLMLGPEIQSLAIAGRMNIADLLRPILERLSAETGETVDLSVFRGDHVVFVDQVIGSQKLRTVSAVGETFTLTNTAGGKATLALLDDKTVTEHAKREFASGEVAPKPLPSLFAELRRIREGGIASDLDEHTAGISAIGVAFHDPAGSIYSIALPVPSQRFGSKRPALVKALEKARKEVGEILT